MRPRGGGILPGPYGARPMMIDALIDLLGGSAVFYQSQVKLVKV